ncbi:MAG: M48 family metalloprotease [Lewinellaceae bacterium]|nr:M48 family metalloprotease [Lewinellaceae bacterium]MCB9082449.1 M48 family metalloprotease [Lewinellaceae bacterium]
MKTTLVQPIYRLLLIAVGLLLLTTCARNPVTGKKQVMLMSEQQEIALGAQSDPQVLAEFGPYNNAAMQQFINEKGQKMVAVSHRANLPFQFKIVDSPVVNAFALPGGYVYFTRGIMAHFNDEAQFAGVLGHEIGHVTARHSANQYTKQILGQGLLIGGLVFIKGFDQLAEAASSGLQLLFLKFGREDESQSDMLGVEYSTKIGYDAHHMASFFTTLDRLSGNPEDRIPTFLSTHPDPLDRNKKVEELAKEWQAKYPGQQFAINRDQYLRMIDGLVYGEDPQQGFVENGIFYAPNLKFQYPVPADWQVQNSPQQVAMAPKDGKAMIILNLGQGQTLDEAAQATLTEYKLTAVSSKPITVGGFQALSVVADPAVDPNVPANQQQQQAIRLEITLIQFQNMIIRFLGVSALADFNTYLPSFQFTARNFRTLSDPDKLNRKPEFIRIVTVPRNATLGATLQGFNMPTDRQEELAVLNGMQLTDMVTQGMLIKVLGNLKPSTK